MFAAPLLPERNCSGATARTSYLCGSSWGQATLFQHPFWAKAVSVPGGLELLELARSETGCKTGRHCPVTLLLANEQLFGRFEQVPAPI